MNNILSFGGGVDSTALLAIHLNRDEAAALTGRTREEIDAALPIFDAVVFSDPGAEFPKTYENVEIAASICADAGLRFETVRKDGENIVEWLERLGNLPLLPGAGHVCSLKFKAEVLHKWADSQFDGTVTWAIGIEANEGHRKFTSKTTDKHQCIHPLVELGLDRADCERILRHLWPVTVEKSSCFFCPFQTKEELKDLHDNHPDLWAKCQEIEENFKVMSVIKHQRWLDAVAAGKTDPNKRAPVGQWKKNSYAEGARLFAKSEKGSRKTVAEWGDEFANTEIRPIVQDAFECDALYYQFEAIDVADKYLAEATEACVNETYSDAYLIKEARYLLDAAVLQRDEIYGADDFDTINLEVKQLQKFLDRHA